MRRYDMDRQAAGFPIDEWLPLIARTARRRAKAYGMDADDVQQELVLVILQESCRYEPGRSHPANWIFLMATEAVRRLAGPRRKERVQLGLVGWTDSGNRRKGVRAGEDDDRPTRVPLIETAPDHRRSAEDGADDRDEAAAVLAKIDQLPPEQSSVIRLRFGLAGRDPMTLAEIAAELGLSDTAIHERYERGVVKVRRLLGLLTGPEDS